MSQFSVTKDATSFHIPLSAAQQFTVKTSFIGNLKLIFTQVKKAASHFRLKKLIF